MFLRRTRPRVLAIGAHPDDIELGAAGFLFRLLTESRAQVQFLVLTAGVQHRHPQRHFDPRRRRRESLAAARALGLHPRRTEILDYPDCGLHLHVHEIIREIEGRLFDAEGRPGFDLVLTHAGGDTHADHRQVYQATVSATRAFSGTVMLYQAPSTIPNEFRPTFFVHLDEAALAAKVRALLEHQSQQEKDFMGQQRVEGLARSWALFHRTEPEYLEAFEVSKSFWGTPLELPEQPRRQRGSQNGQGRKPRAAGKPLLPLAPQPAPADLPSVA
jgi:LmbE family N-acetylglucosaminyl deacetylase